MESTLLVALLLLGNERTGNTGGAKKICGGQGGAAYPDPEKNEKIRQRRRETLERRKAQEARPLGLKLDRSKAWKSRLTLLRRLFLEAKWFTNHVIARGITTLESDKDYRLDRVRVKAGDVFEERELLVLSSQMKQAVIKRLEYSVKALAHQKKKGMKVGRIKKVCEVCVLNTTHVVWYNLQRG